MARPTEPFVSQTPGGGRVTPREVRQGERLRRQARREHRRLVLSLRQQEAARLSSLRPLQPIDTQAAAAGLRALRERHTEALQAFAVPSLEHLKAPPATRKKAPKPLRGLFGTYGGHDPLQRQQKQREKRTSLKHFQGGGEQAVEKFLKRRKADGRKFSQQDLIHAYKKGGTRAVDEYWNTVAESTRVSARAAPPGELERRGHATGEERANAYLRVMGLHPHVPLGERIYGTVAEWAPLFAPVGGGVQAVARGEKTITEALRGIKAVAAAVRGGRGAGRAGARAVEEIGSRLGSQAAKDAKIARRVRELQPSVSAARRANVQTAVPKSFTELRGQQIARATHEVQQAEASRVVQRAKQLARARPVDALRIIDSAVKQQRGFAPYAFLLGTRGGHNLAQLPVQVSRAFLEDQNVRDETFRAMKALPREFVNGVARTAFMLVTDPVSVPKEIGAAYSRTYGPLIAGDYAEFRRRLGERGGGGIVGPILDVAFIGAPSASRLLGEAGKRGLLGPAAKELMTSERPLLQIGEGIGSVRRQVASKRYFKRLSEERRDLARQRYSKQQAERAANAPYQEAIPPDSGRHGLAASRFAEDAQGRPRIVTPRGRGTVHFRGREVAVTPRYPVVLARDTRSVARAKAQAIVARGEDERRLILAKGKHGEPPGAQTLLESLAPQQQMALYDAFQLGIDFSKPKKALEAIDERIRQIKENNLEAFGSERPPIPKARLASHDELNALEQVREALNGGTLTDQRFLDVIEQMQLIQREIESENPRLSTVAVHGGLSEAEMRVAKPYVEFLLRWDERRAKEGLKRRLPEFKGDFDSPEFGTYINDIVRSSKLHGLDAIVHRGAKGFGLKRPHYVASERRDVERFSNRAIGGSRGARRKARYGGSLFRSGRQSRNPRVFLEGMRRGIKDKHQARFTLDVAEGHGASILDRYKAETMDYVAQTEGIPDVVRSRGSGQAINLRDELRGKSPADQFEILRERQVIDPWHVARSYIARDETRFTPEERNALLKEIDRYKPVDTREANPFHGLADAEAGRIAGLERVLNEHSVMPPLLRAMLDSEKSYWNAIRMVQPSGEPLLVNKLKGDLGGDFLGSITSADRIKLLFDDSPGAGTSRAIGFNRLLKHFEDLEPQRRAGRRLESLDLSTFEEYLHEMRNEVYKATQASMKKRGLTGKIIVWRVGPLRRADWDERTPLSFSLDPEPLTEFRHQGRRAAIPYEVDASDVLGDANALVHGGDWERVYGEGGAADLDPFEKAALGDQAPGKTGATGEHIFSYENELLIKPESVRPITDTTLREKVALVKHAGQMRETMTGKQLLDAMDELNLKSSDYVFYNPGLMYDKPQIYGLGEARDLNQAQARAVQQAFKDATLDGTDRQALLNNAEFSEVTGYVPIPRHIFDELAPGAEGKLGRGWDIGKNKFSRVLLGLANVGWIAFQMGANAFLTGMAKVGPLEFFRAQKWWDGLSAQQKRALEPVLNIEPHLMDTKQRFMGFETHDSEIAARYQAFRDSDLANAFSKANIFRRVIDTSFRIDRAQTAAFRRAVFYNSVKKEALERMGANLTDAMAMQGKLTADLFKRDPYDLNRMAALTGDAGEKSVANLNRQINALLQNRVALEHHARTVDEWLGDYVSFTKEERKTLQRFIMFYGFLRHSVRFAFYTMPTRHPVMAGIIGKLALLSDKETRDMLGIDDLPLGLAGLTFKLNGHIMQVNFGRGSPTGNALFEASNPLAIFGMLPPMITLPVAASGFNFFTGRYSQVRGENRYEAFQRGLGGLSLLDRLKLVTHDAESLIPPMRAVQRYLFKGPQGEDTSVIFGASPTVLTEARRQIEQQIKREKERGILGVIESQFGVREVDPGYLRYLQQQEADKRNKRMKGSGGGGYHFPSSSSGGGGFHYGGGSSGGSFNYGG